VVISYRPSVQITLRALSSRLYDAEAGLEGQPEARAEGIPDQHAYPANFPRLIRQLT
jgi:hypothetical protein